MGKTKHRLSIVVWAAETLFANLPLSGRLDAEGVHALRRASKQARAILRLAEDCGFARGEQWRRSAAEVARPFSVLRDAVVMRRLALRLARKLTGPAQAAALRESAQPEVDPDEGWWNERWRDFRRLRRRFAMVAPPSYTVGQVRRGLRRSVRRLLKRARHAHASSSVHRLHQWRKSVIVLRDQLDVLRPTLGNRIDSLHRALSKLGHALGTMMDCEVLIDAVAHGPNSRQRGAADLLAAVEKARHRAIKRAWKHWRSLKDELRETEL